MMLEANLWKNSKYKVYGNSRGNIEVCASRVLNSASRSPNPTFGTRLCVKGSRIMFRERIECIGELFEI